jgi:hypothetical protein
LDYFVAFTAIVMFLEMVLVILAGDLVLETFWRAEEYVTLVLETFWRAEEYVTYM